MDHMDLAGACISITGILFLLFLAMHGLAQKWANMPYFVYNTVGSVTAICTIDEYNEAKRRGKRWTKDGSFLVVPEAVVSGNAPKKFQHLVAAIPVWHEMVKLQTDLFVPFVSEKYFMVSEQEALFFGGNFGARLAGVPPELAHSRVQQWLTTKIDSVDANDWRRRFAQRWIAGSGLRMVIAVGIALFFALGLVYWGSARSAREREATTHYFTDGAQAVSIAVTDEMLPKLPMRDMEEQYRQVQRGIVFRVMPIGGGLDYGCLSKMDGRHVCGFASRELGWRLGTLAFLRPGRANQNGLVQGSEWLWWGINEKEADALERVGFKVKH